MSVIRGRSPEFSVLGVRFSVKGLMILHLVRPHPNYGGHGPPDKFVGWAQAKACGYSKFCFQ
jgi:hypothetical protein